MKTRNLKVLLLLLLLSTVNTVDAQRRGRSRTTGTNPATTNPTADTTKPSQQVNNNTQPISFNPYGNVPIEMAPSSGGFTDSIKPSMRMDGPFHKQVANRVPLPYEDLRPDDALFLERIWREIDIREKINQVFRYKSEDNNGDQRFINMLVKTIRDSLAKGKALAFSGDDDRFTTPLDSSTFERVLSGGNQCDTQAVYDLKDPTLITKYVVVCNTLNPDEIVKFRIKEDWVFDRESSRMFVRIIGIAPLKTIYALDKKTERDATPMFWVYYPEIRPMLAKYEVYNPKNMGQSRMTWEELFESRMFGSYIVKSTLDNPRNQFIKRYIKDPILALLEGDNIKEKIFNYEQDLWSY
ncbi:MAG: gliding motility protein GldN [Chitinophagaceae bacterium]|nr:gliding motility protein GldN [Chitinophagaceae bacterium]